MIEIIHKIHEILKTTKVFKSGYITSNKKEMIIEYEGERYILSLSKMEKPSDVMIEDIKRLSKLNPIDKQPLECEKDLKQMV